MIDYWLFLWGVLTTDTAQTIWLIWLTIIIILDSIDMEKWKNKGATVKWVKGD